MSELVTKFRDLRTQKLSEDEIYKRIKPLIMVAYHKVTQESGGVQPIRRFSLFLKQNMGPTLNAFLPYVRKYFAEEDAKKGDISHDGKRNFTHGSRPLGEDRPRIHDPAQNEGGGSGERSGIRSTVDHVGIEKQHGLGIDRVRGVDRGPGVLHSPGSQGTVQPRISVEPVLVEVGPDPLERPNNFRISERTYGTRGKRIDDNLAAVRLLKGLQAANRKYATQEEQAVLANFLGWGGLKSVFDTHSPRKQDQVARAELQRLLTEDEFFEAQLSVLNAHYTRPEIISFMYSAMDHFGFPGGTILEPTFGIGNFVGGAPDHFMAASRFYGSELDPVSAAIGKYLYPDAELISGPFQAAEFPMGKFDLAIGNPPFGDEHIADRNPNRKDISGMKIHNYVMAKTSMHLRPGGIMGMVMTHRFLDTPNPEARDFLAKNFKMLAAVRLPNDAFKDSAGTEVVTDIIFLQKLMPDEQPNPQSDWLNTNGLVLNDSDEPIRVNAYYSSRPTLILGNPSMEGTMYGSGEQFTVNPREGQDTWTRLRTLIDDEWSHLKGVYKPADAEEVIEFNRTDVSIGGYVLEGEGVYMRLDDDENGNVHMCKLSPETQWTEKTLLGEMRLARITQLLHIREAAYQLVNAERFDAADIDDLRQNLNELYDQFVEKYGYINDPANVSLMSSDVRIESGLEINYRKAISATRAKLLGVSPEPSYAEKATILKERVYFPTKLITTADSTRDAYDVSLSELGRLDLAYVARLVRKQEHVVIEELRDLGLIFQDPESKAWIREDIYLSGNVKHKHELAVAHGLHDNAAALKEVFPKDLEAEQIFVDMGQTWIPNDVYEEFLLFMGMKEANVYVNKYLGQVNIVNQDGVTIEASPNNVGLANPDYNLAYLFNLVANKRPVVAYDRLDRDNYVVNKARTQALTSIVKKFRGDFKSWIFADIDRTNRLVEIYNNTQNTHTKRRYNGRLLKTVGNNPAIEYRDHQRNAAWRMIQSNATLLDHVVGAGKTFCIITGVMERKRLGLSRKPLICVPNHLVHQWASDFQKLYPGANILAATNKDFEKKNRRRLFSKIATGDFDAIICGHSSLGFIPIEPETEHRLLSEEVEYLIIAQLDAEMNGDKRGVRTMANRIRKKQNKMEELLTRAKDNVVSFEQMGIDHLTIDESHIFKNLEYSTVMRNVVGMGNPNGSKMAFDLYSKIQIINDRDGSVTFATGTPISNSLVEMYAVLRYLNKSALEERGLTHFDAWSKMFASVDVAVEYTASGRLKERQVMASFNNLDELLQLYEGVADIVQRDDLQRIYGEQIKRKNLLNGTNESCRFPVPRVASGGRQIDVAPPSPLQQEYMEYLVARAQQLEDVGGQIDPTIDNALWVMSDARKMALDIRLVDPAGGNFELNKVNRAAKNIRRIYDLWNDDRGTQLVFCDLSTPLKNAEPEARKFIQTVLGVANLEKDYRTANILNDLTWEDKWIYLKGKILNEMSELAEHDDEKSLTRHEKLSEFIAATGADKIASLLTADSGFSIYDSLKETLIDLGIPANEVRFIHEANTPSQKEELFDQVKSGRVRVLLGSTPKMGAGTNVQDLLVAEHHLDAPWRPSDIEQREGRAIRQGNLLYMRDPENFVIEICAYSTSNTFDAVMWQILARKAGMLDQFRSGVRNVKNEEGDSASYAEFMAESTGNPIFKERFQLEREIEELESLESNFRAQRASAERTVSMAGSAMESLVRDIRLNKRIIAEMKDISHVTFDGEDYKLDLAEGEKKVMAIYEAAEAEWNDKKAKYEADMIVWQQDIDSGKFNDGDGNLIKGAAHEAKPKKPVGAPAKPTLKDTAEHSEFARLMSKLVHRFKSSDRGHIGSIYLGENIISLSKNIATDGSFLESSFNDEPIMDNRSPERVILYTANPVMLRGRAEKALQEDIRYLHNRAKSTRNARTILKSMNFEHGESLTEKKIRFEFITNEINAIEDVLAEKRTKESNRYILADQIRFPEKTVNESIIDLIQNMSGEKPVFM